MSKENKKETAKEAVETPKNDDIVVKENHEAKEGLVAENPVAEEVEEKVKKEETSKTEEVLLKETLIDEEVKAEGLPEKKVKKVEEFDWDKAAQNDMYSLKERTDLEKETEETTESVKS